ncbi:MAG: trypsin-like peptidase domain-containing protein [Chitinophagales bacterium]
MYLNKTFSFLFVILFSSSFAQSENIKKSLVKIFTTKQKSNFIEPWKKQSIQKTSGTGFIIEGDRIITNAHVVSESKYIQVQLEGESEKYTAKVEFVADDYDLAIIKIDEKYKIKNLPALNLGELPNIQDKIVVYGYPMGGEMLSITEGIVSRVQRSVYSFSKKRYTVVQTDAAINPGNSGGPVIKNGKVIGVAFQGIRGASNIGYVIPVHILKHFISDIKDNSFDGIPSLNIMVSNLESKIYKEMLGLPKGESGVVIQKVAKHSNFYTVLKKNDVILKINNINIGNDGKILLDNKQKISFTYLLEKTAVNENILLEVLRDKKIVTIEKKIEKAKIEPVISSFSSLKAPSYYIKSGFVFEKLSVNLFNQMRSDYRLNRSIPTRIKNLQQNPPEDVEEVVVLISVLSDESNEGFQGLKYLVIDKVNGKKIINFENFVKAINKERYALVESANEVSFVIDNELAKINDKKIQTLYNVGSLMSEDVKPILKK